MLHFQEYQSEKLAAVGIDQAIDDEQVLVPLNYFYRSQGARDKLLETGKQRESPLESQVERQVLWFGRDVGVEK